MYNKITVITFKDGLSNVNGLSTVSAGFLGWSSVEEN